MDTPCGTCFPGIHKYNYAAVKIYQLCSEQYVSLPGGVAGLDLNAVNTVMDWHDMDKEERPEMYEKIQTITGQVIKECREEADKDK